MLQSVNDKPVMSSSGLRMLLSLLLICLVVSFDAAAQQPLPQSYLDSAGLNQNDLTNCGVDRMLANLRTDPAFKQREERMNGEIKRALGSPLADTIITIPVVVHIVNNNPFAITDAQVAAGIQLLNDAFSKSGIYSASLGADTKIRFCLAKTDPDGGISTGITRTTSFFSNSLNKDIEDAKLKNLIQWDPKRYSNIWLITNIESENYAEFTCGVWSRGRIGGYATLPPGGGALDGIVVPGFGSVLAHEMGHYLGLYHTFEGGCTNYDCTVNGDRVCDTPPDNSKAPGCTGSPNSCSTDTLSSYSNGFFPTDVPDQVTNFMDYGNGSCANQFTQGQADRMRAAINTQRTGLLWNACDPPCAESIVAGFTRSTPYSVTGNTINFTNTSSGASSYEWLINDVVVSTAVDFSYTFNTQGKDKITLKAFNTPGCFASYTTYVLTGCGVTARFYTNKQLIASKAGVLTDSIYFTNNSYNGASYQWLMSNDKGMPEQVMSTDVNFKYVFPVPANYKIRLVATNGSCSDTSDYFNVPVQDPTADAYIYRISYSCYGANNVRFNICIANTGFVAIPTGTPVSFYDADPRLPGANKLPSTMYLPSPVPGGNCYNCYTHVLNVPYDGLEKIFVSVNDSGNVVPVVFPNTPLEEKFYTNNITSVQSPRTTIYAAICDGKSYAGYTKPGTYIDTLSGINGCDSIRTLILTVKPVFATTVTTSICAGENYAGHTTSGTFVDVYASANGCDSTRTLYLTVKPVRSKTITAVVCDGQTVEGYSTTGIYVDVFKAANGCDSTRTLRLTVKSRSFTTVNADICDGASYLAGGNLQTTTGTYYDTLPNAVGCDSIITTNLTVHSLPQPDLGNDRGICIGDILVLNPGSFTSYLWQDGSTGSTFSTTAIGHYSVKVTDNFGCSNSAAMNVLRIDPLPENFLRNDTSLCRGNIVRLAAPGYDQYLWNTGQTTASINVTTNGQYLLHVVDHNGCKGADSVTISFYDCKDVWIPNAFTPDVNRLNDAFRPIFPAPVKNYRMQVWNRYGQKIFETDRLTFGWDGRFRGEYQPVGAYVYVITFQNVDGEDVLRKGIIKLIR